MNVAVPDTTQCNQLLRASLDRSRRATQHHGLEAMVVVQVRMQAGDDEVVMVVLEIEHTRRHRLIMVVVDVRNARHTPLRRMRVERVAAQPFADEIAYGF